VFNILLITLAHVPFARLHMPVNVIAMCEEIERSPLVIFAALIHAFRIIANGPTSACNITRGNHVAYVTTRFPSRCSYRKCYNDATEETGRRRAGAPRKYSQVDLVSDNFPRSIHFSARRRRLLLREFPSYASRGMHRHLCDDPKEQYFPRRPSFG